MPTLPAAPARRARTSFGTLGQKGAKFYPSYVGPDRQRHRAPAAFSKKAQAQAWLNAQHAAIQAGEWIHTTPQEIAGKFVPKKNTTAVFEDYARAYVANKLTSKGEPLEEKTRYDYRRWITADLAPFHGRDIAFITQHDVEVWWRDILATGKRTTAARCYQLLSAIFNKAVRDKLIRESPVSIPGAADVTSDEESRVPTDLEVEKVLGVLEGRWRTLFLTAAWSALRRGELINLRPRDFARTHRLADDGQTLIPQVSLRVRSAATFVPGLGTLEKAPKTAASARNVYLADLVSEELITYIDEGEFGPDDLLWPALTNPTKHLSYSVYWTKWSAALTTAGVEPFKPHNMRHYGLTLLAQAGATPKEVRVAGGHTNPTTSDRYQTAAEARKSRLANDAAKLAATGAQQERRIAELLAEKAAAAAREAALDAELAALMGQAP